MRHPRRRVELRRHQPYEYRRARVHRRDLQNIAGIETDGFDVTFNYRTPEMLGGTLGIYWANSFLQNYTLIVPATRGTTEIEREGTEQGSPDQAFPKYKSTAILDWNAQDWGLSLTGRYIGKVTLARTTTSWAAACTSTCRRA